MVYNSTMSKIKKQVEELIKSRNEVYRIVGWSGLELKVELKNIKFNKDERAYIKVEMNDANTKYRVVSTLNGFSDLAGKIFLL